MVAGRPVAVQSPARNKPSRGVAQGGRNDSASQVGEKVANRSLMTSECSSLASRAAGKRAFSSRTAVPARSSFDQATYLWAPLKTRDTQFSAERRIRVLLNNHWMVVPRNAAKSIWQIGRSNQRFTERIGAGRSASSRPK